MLQKLNTDKLLKQTPCELDWGGKGKGWYGPRRRVPGNTPWAGMTGERAYLAGPWPPVGGQGTNAQSYVLSSNTTFSFEAQHFNLLYLNQSAG